jgi:hypothetical protein
MGSRSATVVTDNVTELRPRTRSAKSTTSSTTKPSSTKTVEAKLAEPTKPARAKPAGTKPASAKPSNTAVAPVAEKPAAPRVRKAPAPKPSAVSAEERQRLIAEAAYFIAERRGFAGGSPDEDWRQAEAEVDSRLAG